MFYERTKFVSVERNTSMGRQQSKWTDFKVSVSHLGVQWRRGMDVQKCNVFFLRHILMGEHSTSLYPLPHLVHFMSLSLIPPSPPILIFRWSIFLSSLPLSSLPICPLPYSLISYYLDFSMATSIWFQTQPLQFSSMFFPLYLFPGSLPTD